jgi:hypothetical protein
MILTFIIIVGHVLVWFSGYNLGKLAGGEQVNKIHREANEKFK